MSSSDKSQVIDICSFESNINDTDHRWAVLSHLSTLTGYLIPIPLSNLFGPVLILFTKGKSSDQVKRECYKSINFQITMLLCSLVSLVLYVVYIGIITYLLVMVVDIVLVLRASYVTAKGSQFDYPFSIPIFK